MENIPCELTLTEKLGYIVVDTIVILTFWTNSVDPHQTARRAVQSGSTLFAISSSLSEALFFDRTCLLYF